MFCNWQLKYLAATAVLGAACAHVEAPPGGPEDRTPPAVLTTRPSNEALVPGYEGPVVVVFDERVSERTLEDAVSVSPRTSPVEVRHGRDEIRISLRRGWQPDVIYHVEISREVRDLFSNQLENPIRLVFSTGPPIPETLVTGAVVERVSGELEAGVRVEAIRTDSLVYSTTTDSVGTFAIDRFPEGEYKVRAFQDMNQNRALDPFEMRDSAFVNVAVGQDPELSLRIVSPDSTGPVPASASLRDRVIEVRFDDYLDPEQGEVSARVSIADSVGGTIPVSRAAIGELPAAPDTVAAAPDTVQAAPATPDTTQAPTPAAPGEPPEPAEPAELPLPSQTLLIEIAEGVELVPGADYTVTVDGVQNIVGLEGGGDVEFSVPEEPPA